MKFIYLFLVAFSLSGQYSMAAPRTLTCPQLVYKTMGMYLKSKIRKGSSLIVSYGEPQFLGVFNNPTTAKFAPGGVKIFNITVAFESNDGAASESFPPDNYYVYVSNSPAAPCTVLNISLAPENGFKGTKNIH